MTLNNTDSLVNNSITEPNISFNIPEVFVNGAENESLNVTHFIQVN